MASSASLSEGTLAHRLGRGGGDETEPGQDDVSAAEERYHGKGRELLWAPRPAHLLHRHGQERGHHAVNGKAFQLEPYLYPDGHWMRRGFNAAVCSYLSNVDLGDRGSSLERLKVLNDRSFTEEERGKPYPETADVARPGRAETIWWCCNFIHW